MSNTMTLSRRGHDKLMQDAPGLLVILFNTYVRQWSIDGVTFYDVPEDIAVQVAQAIA